MKSFFPLAIAGITVALAGCAVAVPGDHQAQTPPQLNADSGQLSRYWNNAKLFGPIPTGQQQAAADRACAAQGWGKATGYHAHAKSATGAELPNGGYLCGKLTPEQQQERDRMAAAQRQQRAGDATPRTGG